MPELLIGELKSSPVMKRYPGNPVFSRKDIPYKANLIFNAGVTRYQGRYVMVFRNDYGEFGVHRFEGTNLGLAFSDDGIEWEVSPKPCFELHDGEISRAYDPRLTVMDGRVYMCFAVDTRHGVRGGIAVTDDFDRFEIISMSVPDNRNMVLFPEKIGGMYVRLERPFPVYSRGGERFDTWISDSADLRYWGNSSLLLAVEDVPFANTKTGPAAPPVKTPKGMADHIPCCRHRSVAREERLGACVEKALHGGDHAARPGGPVEGDRPLQGAAPRAGDAV